MVGVGDVPRDAAHQGALQTRQASLAHDDRGCVELLDGPLGREAQGIFADAATAARDVFGAATIADIVEREAREAGAAMYYI